MTSALELAPERKQRSVKGEEQLLGGAPLASASERAVAFLPREIDDSGNTVSNSAEIQAEFDNMVVPEGSSGARPMLGVFNLGGSGFKQKGSSWA